MQFSRNNKLTTVYVTERDLRNGVTFSDATVHDIRNSVLFANLAHKVVLEHGDHQRILKDRNG